MRASGPRPVILTVDDDRVIHEAYRLVFDDDYDVLSALDGPQALEILRSGRVDLMLLDIRLPEMDGLAVLEQARRLRPRLPVIIISVVDTAATALAALRLGALDYVTKPWDEDYVKRAVRRALEDIARPERSPSSAPTTPRVLIVSTDLGVRATIVAALSAQCRVDGASSASAARAIVRQTLCNLIIVDGRSLTEPFPAAVRSLRRWAGDVPVLVIAAPDVAAGSPGTAFPSIDVVLPGFVAERVFREAAALLATWPNLVPVRPPGPLVSRVVQHAAQNFPRLSVEEIANNVGVSPSHLSRKFSAEMGMMTPRDFLHRVRIEAAKCLLKETTQKIEAIAEFVGFWDAPHFTRVFRNHTGQTPRAYRQI